MRTNIKKTVLIIIWILLILLTIAIPVRAQSIEAYRTDNNTINIPYTYDKGLLTIDEKDPSLTFLKEAKISLPCKGKTPISILPTLQYRQTEKEKWINPIQYNKNNRTYNKIESNKGNCEFWVEHFSQYYVNTSGGDYNTLTDCLFAINSTSDTCVINEEGIWTINNTYDFSVNGSAIIIDIGNVSVLGNNSWIRHFGASPSGAGIDHYRKGSNITVSNWRLENFQNSIRMDNYKAGGNYNNSLISGVRSITSMVVLGYGGTNVTNSHFHRDNGAIMSITHGTQYHLNNITFNGTSSCNYGWTNDDFQDSTFNNITVTLEEGTIAGIQFHGGGSQHVEDSNYTNILITTPNAIGINILDGKGHNNRFENITITNATKGVRIGGDDIDTRDNIFININISYATLHGFEVHSSGNQIINNTITNTGNTTIDKSYHCNNALRRYSGSDYNYGTTMFFFVPPSSFPTISADGEDCTAHIDNGASNITLCLFDVQGAGVALATILTTDTCANAEVILDAVYPGTNLDYQEVYALIANGAEQNYTNNYSTQTTAVSGYNNGSIWFIAINNQTNAPIHVTEDNNNLSGNIIQTNDRTHYYDIKLEGTADSTSLWQNHLRTANINNLGSNTNFCINNEGNFYLEGLTVPTGDCGQVNITFPQENQTYNRTNNTITINWTRQSAITNITYYLTYNLNGTIGTIGNTQALNYTWNYEDIANGSLNLTNISIIVRPNDGVVYSTNSTTSILLTLSRLSDIAIIWILLMIILIVINERTKDELWKLIIAGLIFINGILGVLITDSLIGYLVLMITFIHLIKRISILANKI